MRNIVSLALVGVLLAAGSFALDLVNWFDGSTDTPQTPPVAALSPNTPVAPAAAPPPNTPTSTRTPPPAAPTASPVRTTASSPTPSNTPTGAFSGVEHSLPAIHADAEADRHNCTDHSHSVGAGLDTNRGRAHDTDLHSHSDAGPNRPGVGYVNWGYTPH